MPVGSSANRTVGEQIRARATATRCCWPPESCAGLWSRRSVEDYGQTTVMVTHDAKAAAIADRVFFLADGEIVKRLGSATQAEVLEALNAVTDR